MSEHYPIAGKKSAYLSTEHVAVNRPVIHDVHTCTTHNIFIQQKRLQKYKK